MIHYSEYRKMTINESQQQQQQQMDKRIESGKIDKKVTRNRKKQQ